MMFIPKFLKLCVGSKLVLTQALEGTQSTGVPDLGMGKIRSFLIPLPPILEQHRIVQKVEHLVEVCDALEAGLEERDGVLGRMVEGVFQK